MKKKIAVCLLLLVIVSVFSGMMLYDYYCHFNGIAAINKVLKYHPEYPSRPMQEITNNTIFRNIHRKPNPV